VATKLLRTGTPAAARAALAPASIFHFTEQTPAGAKAALAAAGVPVRKSFVAKRDGHA